MLFVLFKSLLANMSVVFLILRVTALLKSMFVSVSTRQLRDEFCKVL